MKKMIFSLMIAIVAIISFPACQQDVISEIAEIEAVTQAVVSVDTAKIAAVLDIQKTLSPDTVPILMAKISSLKSGDSGKDYFVRALHQNETRVFYDEFGQLMARKFSVYIETIKVYEKRYINKIYTISQTYRVIDGVVDLSGWSFDFEFGCPQLKYAQFQKIQHGYDVALFFRSNDADQTLYYDLKDDYWGVIGLLPFANGYWQAAGKTDDGGFPNDFVTDLVDCYNLNNGIGLEIKMEASKIVAGVSFNLEDLKDVTSILIEGTDESGKYVNKRFPFVYSEVLPSVLFYGVSFNPTYVLIEYKKTWNEWFQVSYGCWYENKDGIKYYCLINNQPVPVG